MPVAYTCKACGKQFQGPPSQQRKYCSRACAYSCIKGSERAPRVVLHCLECGKEVRKRQEQVDKGLGHFCSYRCAGTHKYRNEPHLHHPEGTEHHDRIEIPCSCGKIMRLTAARIAAGHVFCSRACINRNRPSPKRKPKIPKRCTVCGTEFLCFPSTVDRHQYCSRQCHGYATQISQPRRETTIEVALLTELQGRGVVCEGQYRMPPWLIDVAIPACRLAIEADGTYWHSLEPAKRRDARKDADLAARGWTVLRFSETEIRESAARCIDKVMEHLT
jgi:very-short-patch-repair endonuclease